MLSDFYSALKPELITIIMAALTGVLTYIGTEIKKIFQEKVKDEKKRNIVKTVVKAINHLYVNLTPEEKTVQSKKDICTLFQENNIACSELEITLLIEEELSLLDIGVK